MNDKKVTKKILEGKQKVNYRFKGDDCVKIKLYDVPAWIVDTVTPDDSDWEDLTAKYYMDGGSFFIDDYPNPPYYKVHVDDPREGELQIACHESELTKVKCPEEY